MPLVALTLLLPLGCFALLAIAWPIRQSGKLAGWLSAGTAVAAFVIAVMTWLDAPGFEGQPRIDTWPWLVHAERTIAEVGFRVDAVSASMLVVVTLVAACVQIYSLGYMAEEPPADFGRYFTWHSLFIFAMGGLVLAPNLLQLLACWELVGLCSYLLIGFYWKKASAGKAAVKAVWVTRFADIGLMSGIVVLYVTTGGFAWDAPLGAAATLIAALLFMGVMGKSAQVPLHVWLPDAMEGPTPVSALLHAATMVAAGVFLVVRAWPIFAQAPDVLTAMSWIGAVTAFVAASTAMVQTDIKKVLAYSTCSQLGYMVAGLGSGSMFGGYWHLTTHAFFKALLFLGAGSLIHAVHSNDVRDMGGMLKKTPVTAVLFITGSLALAGIPPFAGFFSKDLILEELFHAHAYGPFAVLVAVAGMTAFYMTRIVCLALLGTPSPKAAHAHESPLVMLAPMGLLVVLAVGAGFYTGGFLYDLGERWHFGFTLPGALGLGAGVIGIVVGYAKYGAGALQGLGSEGIAAFIRSGPIDAMFTGAWRNALLPIAKAAGWFDRYVIDAIVNLFGWAALVGSASLRSIQTGRVKDYLYLVVVGVVFFAAWGAVAGGQ